MVGPIGYPPDAYGRRFHKWPRDPKEGFRTFRLRLGRRAGQMAAGGATPRSSPGPPARGGKWHVVTSQIAFEVTFTDDLANGPCTQQSLYGYEVLIGQHNNRTLMDVKAVLEASYEKVPVRFIE